MPFHSTRPENLSKIRDFINLGSHDEIIDRKAAHGMGYELEGDCIVAYGYIRVMTLRFGQLSDRIHERESLNEVLEFEVPRDLPGIGREIPIRDILRVKGRLIGLERTASYFAGNAFFI